MLNIFSLANGRLFQEEIESLEELARFQPIWVDLESPTLEEKRWVKQHYGLSIPEDAMDEDIEESARFYEQDNGDLHIRSDFLVADDTAPGTVARVLVIPMRVPIIRKTKVHFSQFNTTKKQLSDLHTYFYEKLKKLKTNISKAP